MDPRDLPPAIEERPDISTPALQALRSHHAEAQISVLARPWVADLYKREPFCDELIPYEAPRG